MRSLLIKVIVGMLCFTLVGVSWVWAGSVKDYSTKDGKIFKVYLDDNGKIIKGEYNNEHVWPIEINTLKLKLKQDKDKREYDIISFSAGTVIYTSGSTCIWVFDGYQCVYKCF